jgi:hypothetical protein
VSTAENLLACGRGRDRRWTFVLSCCGVFMKRRFIASRGRGHKRDCTTETICNFIARTVYKAHEKTMRDAA